MKRTTTPSAALAVAGLLLAACGSADEASPAASLPSAVTVDAGDDALRAPAPIEYISGGSQGLAAESATESSAALDSGTADLMPVVPWTVEYEVGDLPSLPTNDIGYVFDATVPVEAADVARVASAFGVMGEPILIDEGYGVTWRVGPDDGSAPSIWVFSDGQRSWNYQAPWSEADVMTVCSETVDSEGNEFSDCPEPELPVGVPTAEEAERRALEIFAALGLDAESLVLDTSADEWSANVSAERRTEIGTSTSYWSVGFGAEGVLQYASGSLADPAPVGPYPLIGLDQAIERLRDGSYGFGGFGGFVGAGAVTSAVAVDVDAATSGLAPTSDPSEEPIVVATLPDDEPMPTEPMPGEPMPGEPAVFTLVDVVADFWWAWDNDNSSWLLPAYRFIDTEGGWHVVPAVTDEFLIQVEPDRVDPPIPVDADGGIGDGAEPLPAPVSPDVADIDPEAAAELLSGFVGLSIEEFTAEAAADGFETRIVERDGEPLMVTEDFRTNRVNVVVEGPRVTSIVSIG